ncbi:B3 DNA binding domain containing protein, partial [Trema orientale]
SEKRAALQRTGGFESDRPSFEVVMQPYYVRGKRLAFPSNFAKKHLKKRNEDVILKLPNGKKTWLVKYFFGEHKKAAPLFRGGWKAFARDNDLKVGDVCVFVLLEGEVKVSFEVLIFRDRGISNAPMSPAHDETSTPSDRENLHSDQANGCK